MKTLAPSLFQRRFQDLMEIGRASLPALAPDWTDHNAHDPGITLMELLAWVAEAQMYSLSRARRDERMAYAALLGIVPAGTRAAFGLIWPDRLDPNSPARTFTKSVVIPVDALINVMAAETPTFRPLRDLLWAPGEIERLETRGANGRRADHKTSNERGGFPFLPFGESTGRREVLTMSFKCRDKSGLFGSNRPGARGAFWPIGFLVAPPLGGVAEPATLAQPARSPLEATLVTDDNRIDLRIASDSTEGLLASGALLLDLDNVTGSPERFAIELRAPGGFPRPPQVLRIEPNVIPILQGRAVPRELHVANGTPDWSFRLNEAGLRFDIGEEPVIVEVAEPTGMNTWRPCDRLSEKGPNDNAYEFDAKTGEATFGNGVNGRCLPTGAQVFATYSVSDGAEGRVARNRKWQVAGFEGTFGVNPDPITGGADSTDWIEMRREARKRSRDNHALVSSDDITTAAKALPLLEVARAWVVEPDSRTPRTGAVTLVAMRNRSAEKEPERPPETPLWLETIRWRLAPRMPLGSRLVVVGPGYIEFSIQAVLTANPGTNPSTIKEQVEKEFNKRLALVDSAAGVTLRQPGVSVSRRDVAAWARATAGVKRVVQLQLQRADGQVVEKVVVPRGNFPRWNSVRSTIDVRRSETGGPR